MTYEIWRNTVSFIDDENRYVGELGYRHHWGKILFYVAGKVEPQHADEIAGMLPEISKRIRMLERRV